MLLCTFLPKSSQNILIFISLEWRTWGRFAGSRGNSNFWKDCMFFREGSGVRETLISWLSYTPNWVPGPQPRHVPWLGIEPATFWFTGQHSSHWATPDTRRGCLTVFPKWLYDFTYPLAVYEGSSLCTFFCTWYFSVFLIKAILVDMSWYHSVVLVGTFIIANDIEQLFMCLLAICISSLEKYLFRS